jgi:alpha-1,6-mannosyltransferase
VVVAPGPRDEVALLSTSDAPGTSRVVRIGGPSLPYDPTYHLLGRLDKIRAIVAEEQPDVLEVHSPYLAMAGAFFSGSRAARARTFFWHGDPIDTYAQPLLAKSFGDRIASAVLKPLWGGVGAMLKRCDATFAAGLAQADKLRALGASVVHVPFGVDKRVFHPGARDEALRAELARGHARVLVGIGRFAIEKRWDVVLDAFVSARDSGYLDARLVLFGDGPERARLEARVRGRDDVAMPGFEKDRAKLASALASADLLVHGCPYETFGLSIAEAMACGLPVVVPDRGGACESIDPRASEVYPSLDPGACAAAIGRILSRDPDSLRTAARQAALAVWSEADHFQRVLDHYARLAP